MSYEILANNVIRVTASDGCSHTPPNTTITEEPDGSMNYYHYLPTEEKKNHDWRKRVGQRLAVRLKTNGAEIGKLRFGTSRRIAGWKMEQ